MDTTTTREQPTEQELERVRSAVKHIHATVCKGYGESCIACTRGAWGVLDALRVLDANSKDARGARVALHDAVCMSGCGPESDHAHRTQAPRAAALRKFRAIEGAA